MQRSDRQIVFLLFLPLLATCASRRANRIVIGAKNFTEQVVLAEILAQHIASRTALEVERRINLGGTLITQHAITSGEIDAYVEYTGTALMAVLGEAPSGSKEDVYKRVQGGYASRFHLAVLQPLGFENTFAMVIRGAAARRLKLRRISDIRPYTSQWRAGFGYEFMERPDGFRGFVKKYQLQFSQRPRTLDLGLLYRALEEKQVDIVAGNSTDGAIKVLDLVVLEDDQHYFPPYEAVPIVREEALTQHPEVRAALKELSGKFSADDMRHLNYAVDGEHRDVREIVREFLRAKKL